MDANESEDRRLDILLSSKQRWLATEHDWPYLEDRWDVAAPANVTQLPLPTLGDGDLDVAINFGRPVRLDVWWNDVWTSVEYGIGKEQWNVFNTGPGASAQLLEDPIQRWRFVDSANIEVWPIPTVAQTLRFSGQRQLEMLEADTDTADLDDMLLVYTSAADEARRLEKPNAQFLYQLAQNRLVQVRENFPAIRRRVVLGENCVSRDPYKRQGVIIATAPS